MRECFSLFTGNNKKIGYYMRIMFNKYYDNTPIWKMIVKDTLADFKQKLKIKLNKKHRNEQKANKN